MQKFMIFLLMTFAVFWASLSHAQHNAQDHVCKTLKPYRTAIDVHLEMPEEPYYDLSLSLRDLNRNMEQHKLDWLEENNMREVWRASDMEIQGLASTGMAMLHEFQVEAFAIDKFGAYWCPYFKNLYVELFYRTMIQIPKKYKPGSCQYKLIDEHELKHHVTNKTATAEYFFKFHEDVHKIVAEIENQPSITRSQFDQRVDEMKQAMEDAMYVYFVDMLGQDLHERNALIDTPEEYANVSKALDECPRAGWW